MSEEGRTGGVSSGEWLDAGHKVAELLVGDRYGTLEKTRARVAEVQEKTLRDRMHQVIQWLRLEM